MAATAKLLNSGRSTVSRLVISAQRSASTSAVASGRSLSTAGSSKQNDEVVTHTGQVFQPNDYRKVRFTDAEKLVNPRFAIDLIAEDPVVICTKRVVSSDSGGPLGHPKVYINLDKPGMHICGYSGRKFVLKKYYDQKTMGPSISYSEYLKQIGQEDDDDDGHGH